MPFALQADQKYSYADYLSWPDDERWEIIEGRPYIMEPAPARRHQKILRELSYQFQSFLKDKRCEVYFAPFDVRLPGKSLADEEIYTVVQPDLAVICDPKKLDEKGCLGSPDLVVEILSPSSASRDIKEKFDLYEKHRVKEYWLIHPEEKILEISFLDKDGDYGRPKRYDSGDKFSVSLLSDLEIDLNFLNED